MYFAKSLKELLRTTELNYEFFLSLDDFYISYLDSYFLKIIDEQFGMLEEIEAYNYEVFLEFKKAYLTEKYGIDPDYIKKVG